MSRISLGLGAAITALVAGCQLQGTKSANFLPTCPSAMPGPMVQLTPSNANESGNMPFYMESHSPMDWDESSIAPDQLADVTLQECITMALATSRIMRDLGVSVIRSPQAVGTNLDTAIVYSDPRLGEEAALSAFDANFFASSFYEDNDRRLNNQFFGVQGEFTQALSTSQIGINKRSATGGLYGLRKVTLYDRNNQLSNSFKPFSWEEYIEAQIRQPLLQGAGTQFNRIAGPGAAPGQLNGVLLARTRTDANLVEFERSVRDFVAEVENSYWDLYFAYRDLDARIQVRDIAQETLATLASADTSAGKRAQAQEQVDRFQSEVIDSLNGRAIDGTRTNNGSVGGTFRGTGGIRVSERKLRLLIGLPINDGRMLHPTEIPTTAEIVFDWDNSLHEALTHREELRKQRWIVKQRELELIANRNFLRPQLDLVSQYRMRGFGKEFDNAYTSLSNGQYQEWQMGIEYQMPVGFRRANAAVRNSQLALVRESEILKEQERSVHYGLSNAINESKRAHQNLALQEKRLQSIVIQLNAIDAKKDAFERAELDVRLETHRRLLDARLRYHQSEVEYMLSLRNVNVEKGCLLRYCNVWLNETPPSAEAVTDAVQRIAAQDYDKVPESRDILVGRSIR
ncbi:MAG: TolC family protein [Pirellula sp.]